MVFEKMGGFTHIIHGATDSTLGAVVEPLLRFEQIFNGTRNALEFAARAGVKRFLLTSSGAVYGPQPSDLKRIPEHYLSMPDPLDANNVYGVAKLSEHLCALYARHYQIEPVVARCFAFVGPDLPLQCAFRDWKFHTRRPLRGRHYCFGRWNRR